ncbi:MAG: hypothetical protein ACREUU_00160 [Gammaproteobacteria bacterium]
MKRVAAVAVMIVIVFSLSSAARSQQASVDRPATGPASRKVFIPRQLRIQFVEGVQDETARAFLRALRLQIVRVTAERLYQVRVRNDMDIWTVTREVNLSPLVLYAVPDYVLVGAAQPVGPLPPRLPQPAGPIPPKQP